MRRVLFLDVLIVLLIVASVIEIFYLPSLQAKLFLSLVSCALLVSLLKGKVSNKILAPISLLLIVAGVVLIIYRIIS